MAVQSVFPNTMKQHLPLENDAPPSAKLQNIDYTHLFIVVPLPRGIVTVD